MACFQLVANHLVGAGIGNVRCLEFGCDIKKSKIVINDNVGRPGWNCDRIVCPNGHSLLVIRTVHLSGGRSSGQIDFLDCGGIYIMVNSVCFSDR